ncbi:MAG TPA: spore coat protein [Candidatus Gallacutalibacter pullistercoris]|nr:spore coat protein [Candidatus Gallacutalibacter pullistercoris]
MELTEKELLLLEEQLHLEQLMEEKCLAYAPQCEDPQLRMKLESLAGRHRVLQEQLSQAVTGELGKDS